MYITQQQEQFSNAYLLAVATVAQCTLAKPDVDDDSVDYTIKAKGYTGQFSRPCLDVQLKCHKHCPITSSEFSYSLKIKNYDDLRAADVLVPRILIVLITPDDVNNWLSQSDSETILRHSAYWSSIRNKPPSNNTSTVSVSVSKSNRLTPEELMRLMQIVANGGAP